MINYFKFKRQLSVLIHKQLGYRFVLNTKNDKLHTIGCPLVLVMKDVKFIRYKEAVKMTLSNCSKCI